MQHKLIIAIFITLFSFSFTSNGQKLVNSPYSRFNIGTMEPAGSFRSMGMGGIGVALRENSSIYFSNPASYSSLDTNSFVFDFGLDYSRNTLSEGEDTYSSDDLNFDHLLIGFPIAKGWGVAAGITPLSNGYYRIEDSVEETDPMVGEYTAIHGGDGGFTSFFLGSGVNLNKNFSAGINMTLLFGQIQRINQFDFINPDDFYNVYHNNSTEKLQLGGINFDYGLQYTASLKDNYFFTAGVSLTSSKYYNSKYENLSFRNRYSTLGGSVRDTISLVADDSTSALFPGTLRLGISFGKKNKFIAGIDYISTKWSASKIPGADGYIADTRSILFGVEYIPEKYSNYSFIKRLEYRIGGHVGDNYIIINGEQLKEVGASLGIGFPMRRSFSKANLFFDYTRKYGSAINGFHTENYYTMGVSLNLYDVWFLKRMYD